MKKLFKFFLSGLFILTISTANAGAQSRRSPVFNHMSIYVTNLKKSVAFYMDVLGLDTIPEPFKDGKHAWFDLGSGRSLHIIEGATGISTYNRQIHSCFSVLSVPEFTGVLKKNEIAYEDRFGKANTITKRPDGVNQIYFKDPDNYWIEVNDEKL